jgi:hypothetical protein
MTTDVNGGGTDNADLNQAQRLLEELYRQRTELGEIAAELISLLEAAGVSTTDGPDNQAVDSPPG